MKKKTVAALILSLFLGSCLQGFSYGEEGAENLQTPPVLTEEASSEMTPRSLSELDAQHYDVEKDFRFALGGDVLLFKNVFEPETSGLLPERRQSSEILRIDREQLSYFLEEVGRMFIEVKGQGKKVNKIEILQNDRLLVRTYNIESYSTIGRYILMDFQILQPFLYPDGENPVLVNFYGNEILVASHPYTLTSVAHAKITTLFVNFKGDWEYSSVATQTDHYVGLDTQQLALGIEVIGCKENDLIEIDLIDSDGTKIAGPDFMEENYYLDWNGSIKKWAYFSLSPGTLKQGMILIPRVHVNGEIVHDNEAQMEVVSDPEITSYPRYEKMPDSIKLGIVNGDRLRNAHIEFWQDDQLVGITREYEIKWDNWAVVHYMDIPMKDHYFSHPGEEFTLKLYDSGRMLFEQKMLPPRDVFALNADNWLVEDGFSPTAKILPMLFNQPVDKIFRVHFSDPIDIRSITNTNAYVRDKKSGKRLELDLSKLKLSHVGNKHITEYEMTAAIRDQYRPGQLYILVLEPGIRSLNGKELTKQVVLYFTTR